MGLALMLLGVLPVLGIAGSDKLDSQLPPAPEPPRLSPRPVAVTGTDHPLLDLGGTWQFSVISAADFAAAASEPRPGTAWAPIQVPGQWLQEGFPVNKDSAGLYRRTFTVPADWSGKQIKLRCDAAYSDATVWINGRLLGHHLGGFTPFEFDVTTDLQPGQSAIITLALKSEGEADKLASGIKYAGHDLGGITRKIQIMAVPALNLASIHLDTQFDGEFKNATLGIVARLTNDGDARSEAATFDFVLSDPQGHPVPIQPAHLEIPALSPSQTVEETVSIPVASPKKWDPDHPWLYTLGSILQAGQDKETVSNRVGFRQVEVRGQQVFVNGRPVKLRGVCRHETDPLRGRSLAGGTWRQDVETFAHANINFIRTSHYPPAEEFLDACDELGMFVESEAPLCWAKPDAGTLPTALRETAEMVEFNRNHPSVIIWSVANESTWSPAFDACARMIRDLDPTRPRIFSFGGVDLISWHYPENDLMSRQEADYTMPSAPNWAKNRPLLSALDLQRAPVLCDEYGHLNAYNRREQIGDPGLRDAWGLGLSATWEEMESEPGCLGGALWAGIDDTFFLPDGRTIGYGTWGVLDGWRRPKPEYWHVTKVYSPVRILDSGDKLPAPGHPLRLIVENRSDFTDLREMRFVWKLAGRSGVAKTEGEPGGKGILEIPSVKSLPLGGELEIKVVGPRGFMVDAYRFTLGGESASIPSPPRPASPLKLTQDNQVIRIDGNGFAYLVDAVSGQFRQATVSGHDLPFAGPCLTLVPHDAEGGGIQLTGKEPTLTPLWGLLTGWKASSVTAAADSGKVRVKVTGNYAEATGGYELICDGTGRLTVRWNFTVKSAVNPRQTGVTFLLPKDCDTLWWKRRGQWSFYPDDHIGRPIGTARAFPGHPACGLAGPRTPPSWPWSEDQNEYGSNDFRSTKFNIFEATLTNEVGTGLRTVADGNRHVHAWMDGDHAQLAALDYANDGSENFFQATRRLIDRKIPAGGTVAGSVQVEVTQKP